MAKKARKTSKAKQSPKKGRAITVGVTIAGLPKGHNVVFAQGSSNHYTSTSFTSDTCCTCGQ